jgi:3-deoxy-manno-octulosonate cytidylyltransferase (CMP-KDO synthetase)
MRYAIIIPARYQSSRLPGKPLVSLCGTPMILRTVQQCLKYAAAEQLYVATDHDRIAAVCAEAGIQVVMTSSECLTGTDRVAEAAQQISADIYVNVQGDEPLFNPDDLRGLIQAAQDHPGEILNGYCAISNEAQFRSTNVPKVVAAPDGRLLYMSRAPVPTDKAHSFIKAWRQVCAYAFPPDALRDFAATPKKTPLEEIEDIEILRFLELGWPVRMVPMSDASIAVDLPADVERAELAIRRASL